MRPEAPEVIAPPAPRSDRFLDQWLASKEGPLKAVVREVAAGVLRAETRQRGRSAGAEDRWAAIVETVIANLAHTILADPDMPRRIAVLKGNDRRQTRYDRRVFRQLSPTLHALHDAGILTLRAAARHRASTIEPTPRLRNAILQAGVSFADFDRLPGEQEVLILSAKRHGFKDDSRNPGASLWGIQASRVDYPETPATATMRAEVRAINGALGEADIRFFGNAVEGRPVDHHARLLRRYFAQPHKEEQSRFDLGGRLFGPAFWLNLPRTQRHLIRIDGKEVVDLDYRSMFPRLAVLKVCAPPLPDDVDPYAVPGLEGYRNGVKAMVNTLLFAGGLRRSIPAEIKAELPPGWTAPQIRQAIITAYPSLEAAFERGLGLSLMFTESTILITVMLRLIPEGITALPMHDGLLCARPMADRVKKVMEEVSAVVLPGEGLGEAGLPVVIKAL